VHEPQQFFDILLLFSLLLLHPLPQSQSA